MKKYIFALIVAILIVPFALMASYGDHVLSADDPMYPKVVAAANAALKEMKLDWGKPIAVSWNDSSEVGLYYAVDYAKEQHGEDDDKPYYVIVTKKGNKLVANPRIGRS